MHKALLRRWCDAMLKYQLHDTGDTRLDGGLLCPALTVQADRPLTLPPEYGTPVRFRRLFNPVGGFQSVVLTLPAEHPFTVTLEIGDKE